MTFAQKTPTDMVSTFNEMQNEAFRIQKDMYIRIEDLKLLDLSENKIYDIMKKAGASKKIINTTGLDEIAKGISSGTYDLQNSLGSIKFFCFINCS